MPALAKSLQLINDANGSIDQMQVPHAHIVFPSPPPPFFFFFLFPSSFFFMWPPLNDTENSFGGIRPSLTLHVLFQMIDPKISLPVFKLMILNLLFFWLHPFGQCLS